MGRPARVSAAVLALVIGGLVAYGTRSTAPERRNPRPAPVERVVRALDRLGPTTRDELSAALAAAGAPAGFSSPWREEVELGALVFAGDRAALEAFAKARPPSPARARAWVRLALDGADADLRRAALDGLRADYPDSAAARVFDVRSKGSGK